MRISLIGDQGSARSIDPRTITDWQLVRVGDVLRSLQPGGDVEDVHDPSPQSRFAPYDARLTREGIEKS